MLETVVERLRSQGVLHLEGKWSCNVNIRWRRILADVYDTSGRHFHLRMSEADDLEAEYRRMLSISDVLGRFVLRPKQFARVGRVSCIISEGMAFRAVGSNVLLRLSASDPLHSQLLDFLSLSVSESFAAAVPPHLQERDGLLVDRLRGTKYEELLHRVLQITDRAWVSARSRVPQHGDFVLSNLVIHRRQLLVLDWEDFGRVRTPGFDLATLLCSALDFDAGRLRSLCLERDETSEVIEWLSEALRRLGLSQREFVATLPHYLLEFLAMKERYTPKIRQRVARGLEGLL